MKKYLVYLPAFFLLVILQASFLPHFALWGRVVNITLIFNILINIAEPRESKAGLLAAVWGGLLLDAFSGSFFGLNITIMLVGALFIKTVFKKYVRIPVFEKI